MKWLLVLLFVGSFVGCSSTASVITLETSNHNVVVGNTVLGENLKFTDSETKHINGFLSASVKVSNHTDQVMSLAYRFYWYDRQGLEVNLDDTAWHKFQLNGKQTLLLTALASKKAATQYRIYVRNAER